MSMEVRFVEWIDSMGGSNWTPLEDVRTTRPMHIYTAGFVADEDDDYVTILQSFDERKDGRPHGDNYICIPKFAIKSSRTLEEPSE